MKRNHQINVRVTAAEKEFITLHAKRCDQTSGEHVREFYFEKMGFTNDFGRDDETIANAVKSFKRMRELEGLKQRKEIEESKIHVLHRRG